MPLIELQLPALDADARDRLVDRLTEHVLRWREVPDTAGARENVWTYVRHPGPGESRDGTGLPNGDHRCLARISVVAGGLDDRRKAGLVRDATAALEDAFGADGGRVRAWVLIDEVPDGNWGADGVISRFADAQRLLGAVAEGR